jgi:hypothetical protein
MVLKTFVRSTKLDTSQLFELLFKLQDNDKSRCTVIENGSVDWCPAHLYRNHNRKGEPELTEAVYKIPNDNFKTENVK